MASTKSNPVLHGGDITAIFKDFLAQRDGGISRARVSGARYGTVQGRIGSNGEGNGVIYRRSGAGGSQDEYDAIGIVNELPHLAGSREDGRALSIMISTWRALRVAVDTINTSILFQSRIPSQHILTGDPRGEPEPVTYWSTYFHNILN